MPTPIERERETEQRRTLARRTPELSQPWFPTPTEGSIEARVATRRFSM
jgi:hypothetical protein